MPGRTYQVLFKFSRCLRESRRYATSIASRSTRRRFSRLSPQQQEQRPKVELQEGHVSIEEQFLKPEERVRPPPASQNVEQEAGAMSRRLAEATEDTLLEGGRAGRKAVEEAGFSEELKLKLLERLEGQKFKSENMPAFTEAGLPSILGKGSRDIATSQAWTGSETIPDTVLRMLDDARKPLKPGLRGPAKIPSPIVDLRLQREPKQLPAQRLATARDKSSVYSSSKDTQISEKERAALRKELKERFTPGARSMPNTIRGLEALANERIEDAIARGQFKNIPRGKAIERDARADNPFINTTEYFLNKMIQRQEIVPPWIEKQQELVKAARVFRTRLRNDWKRHAARTISSRGGSLQEQMQIADRYAEIERLRNPKKRAVEQISVPTNITDDPVMVNIVQETSSTSTPGRNPLLVQVSLETEEVKIPDSQPAVDVKESTTSPPLTFDVSAEQSFSSLPTMPLRPPFRIPAWEAAELSYLKLAIENLNNITRSYNLMAPEIARKPYFSLDRELNSCYADIAPELSEAIKERAARPARNLVEKVGHRPGGVMEKFGGDTAKIYDSKKPQYGFKEFWNDLFRKEKI